MFVEGFELPDGDLSPCARTLAARSSLAWLDGTSEYGEAGRFSFLGCDPVETRIGRASEPTPLLALENMSTCAPAVLLVDDLTSARVPRWVGYVAYDACWSRSDVAAQRHARPDHPVLWFARYDAWLVLDHARQRAFLVGDDRDACDRLREKLMSAPVSLHATACPLQVSDATAHGRAIEIALSEIARGNLYQVNLARSFAATLEGDPLALWFAIRAQGDVPFGMYLDVDDHQVLARTMELFLRWDRTSRELQTRPIKGTIARSGNADEHEAETLRNDDKERAEHAMIVDLMRNDLGRVAEVGSVKPVDVMRVEPYSGLSHLVSTVTCRTRPDVTLSEVFEATFPPGSVTGTPKLAAIAAIEQLEAEPRGIYTGAVGHIDQTGGCHFAVAIRTAIVRDGLARYFAGGGIVEASQVGREVAETELKARPFVGAIESMRDPNRL